MKNKNRTKNDARLEHDGARYVVQIDRSEKTFLRSLEKLPVSMRRSVECRLARLGEYGLLPGDRIEKPWGWERYGTLVLRASDDLRLVCARRGNSLKLFFLGRHDEAYRFAARHRKNMAVAG